VVAKGGEGSKGEESEMTHRVLTWMRAEQVRMSQNRDHEKSFGGGGERL
jgi:hypothetical protein